MFTSEYINEELIKASAPSLDRSLSVDSKSIIDIPYEDYIQFNMIGPRSLYRIVALCEEGGKTSYRINDRTNNTVDPDIAKIIINPKTKRPRMLFKDPNYKEWVEPESFYPFSSTIFYEEDQNIHRDQEGFTIEAIKSSVWHGVSAIGVKIKTDKETLVFSSDTVHDKELWVQLYTEKKVQKLNLSKKEFESSSVIYGDINDYIERIWSQERYIEATNTFDNAVVIHDIAGRGSIVHTDYKNLKTSSLDKGKTLLTHSPDRITTEWKLCNSGKIFKIKENNLYEMVDGKLFPMDADIYHREDGRYFVGYKNEKGKHLIYENDGLLDIAYHEVPKVGIPLYRVDLYEDISGKYFPMSYETNAFLYERKDGKVERVEFTEQGSTGKVLENLRGKIRNR